MGNYNDLASAIVQQAVLDYKDPVTSRRERESIEEFFDSKWCNELLGDFPLDGKEIINVLGGY